MTSITKPQPALGWITVPTYPLFAPYKVMPDSGPRAFVGKPVRLMSMIIDTLILDDAPCWDASTRTLHFNGDFQRYARITNVVNGGHSRSSVDQLLESYLLEPWPVYDGEIRVAENIEMHSLPLSQRWMRVSEDYMRLITEYTPHRISFERLPQAGFALDLYVICCMYTPEGQRLHIPESTLWEILPQDSLRRTQSRYYEAAARQLNMLDNGWEYRYERDHGFDAARTDTGIDAPGSVLRIA